MDKIILAIETSTEICGVSLIKGENILALVEGPSDRRHAEILPESVQEAMQISKVAFDQISAIAVSIGPGSFTGLRVGLGFAKGMAYGHDLPIVPVPTLLSLAYGLSHEKPLKGITHSHSKKIFYQEFLWDNKLPKEKSKVIVGEFDLFIDRMDSGFQSGCDVLMKNKFNLTSIIPSASLVAKLASSNLDKWAIEQPYGLEPDYIAPFEIHSSAK